MLVGGGLFAYISKGSVASLAGGAGSGLLLIIAGYLSLNAFGKRKNSYLALLLETGIFYFPTCYYYCVWLRRVWQLTCFRFKIRDEFSVEFVIWWVCWDGCEERRRYLSDSFRILWNVGFEFSRSLLGFHHDTCMNNYLFLIKNQFDNPEFLKLDCLKSHL